MPSMHQNACAFFLTRGYSQTAVEAALLYVRRKLRIDHPQGHFDKGRRFFLDEPKGCHVRSPSRLHPYSEMLHGRTLRHCGHLFGAPELHVRRIARATETWNAVAGARTSNHAIIEVWDLVERMLKSVKS